MMYRRARSQKAKEGRGFRRQGNQKEEQEGKIGQEGKV